MWKILFEIIRLFQSEYMYTHSGVHYTNRREVATISGFRLPNY